MEIQVLKQPFGDLEAGAVAVIAFERGAGETALEGESAVSADKATGGWIADLFESGELSGKLLESAILARPAGMKAKRLVVIGGGKREQFTASTLRKIAGALVRLLKPKKCRGLILMLDPAMDAEAMASAAVEGALLGHWEPDQHKTDPKKNESNVERFALAGAVAGGAASGAERGRILGESQNFARDLISEPANLLPPGALAQRALAMAGEMGLDCEVLGPERMKQLGMGAMLGVAQGSAEPPALIVVRYRPQAESGVHLGLLGKGVTFDTGGISIKPADGMEKMKYDMAGGAAVLGAMRALALLKPPVTVTALVPAVENMPGSKAQRPGDIVKTLSGKTVEVLNTDAEGRLILCDAIEYAKRLGCTHLVDAATLTGAIVIALGFVNVGVFSNDDAFRAQFLEAAGREGEKMWPMPLDDEYKELLKSPFADMGNIGGRWGGAVTAAMFLKEFADPQPWIHLDIAGTAWIEETKPFLAKGPSGIAMRTFVNLAMNWKLPG